MLKSVFARTGAAVVSSALMVPFAFATVDTTAAEASLASVKTSVLAIGLIVFGIAVAIKLYKWLRRAL